MVQRVWLRVSACGDRARAARFGLCLGRGWDLGLLEVVRGLFLWRVGYSAGRG